MIKLSNFKDLKENISLQIIVILGAVFLFVGKPVPDSNEFSYLLRLRKVYDSTYLANDITFSTATDEYWLYEHIFGVLTLIFPVEVVGWIGRIAVWSILLFALMKLGKRWEIPTWMISVSIFLWLYIGQSIIANEWMFGTFEAKCVAYICLIFALDYFCEEKFIWGAILLGFTFAFHPVIGLWGIAASVPALLICNRDIIQTIKVSIIAGVISLIGVIPLLLMRANSVIPTTENLIFFELVMLPHHFDPFSWARSAIVLLGILMLFCIIIHLKTKNTNPPEFLLAFLIILGVFFAFGVLFRAFNLYELMKYTSTRLFAVFIPLFFFFYLSKAYYQKLLHKPLQIALLLPIILLAFWNKLPTIGFEQVKTTYQVWTQESDDMAATFTWLKNNTSKDITVIAPPWRYDFWYLSERAEIVNANKPIIADIGEWQKRLVKLNGKTKPEDGTRESVEFAQFYYDLTKEQIDAIATEYKAEYLISETDYPYQVVFSKGKVKVFHIKQDQK